MSGSSTSTKDVGGRSYNCRDFSIARLLDSGHPSSSCVATTHHTSCSSRLITTELQDVTSQSSVDGQVWREGRLSVTVAEDTELRHQISSQRQLQHHLQQLMLHGCVDGDGRPNVFASTRDFTADEQQQATDGRPQLHQGPYSPLFILMFCNL